MDELDVCYECTGYGDDYYTDENGNMVCACDDCPFNRWGGRRLNDALVRKEQVKQALMGWDVGPTDEEIEFEVDNIPAVDAVSVERFKAQMIDLVKSYEVLIGCTGVSVLTRAIERMTVAMVEEE